MKTDEDCFNCGAGYGLHQSETENCPLYGIEETRDGHKQRWAGSKFHPYVKGRLEELAPEMYDAIKDCIRYFTQNNCGGYNGEGKQFEKGSAFEKVWNVERKMVGFKTQST